MLSFEQRKKLLTFVSNHKKSGFYNDLYQVENGGEALTISSEEEWRLLPTFTKDALIPIQMSEVSFLPLKEIDHVRASSGTSGKPPLFSPRTKVRGVDYRLKYHDFKKPILSFGVPLMPHWHEEVQGSQGSQATTVTFDPQNPDVSARLAAAVGVDAISFFVHHIKPAGEALKKCDYTKEIKFVELAGGLCSRALYEYIEETFPNAIILPFYGSSETEDVPIGIPCHSIDGNEPLSVYHQKDSEFLEIVNPETGDWIEPVPGAEGDLLITSYPGEPCAFPLVRFRIGDTIRVVENNCEHDTWSFTVLGRTELDFLKVQGGVLKADEVVRALLMFESIVTDDFELHSYENEKNSSVSMQIEVHVEPKIKSFDFGGFARDFEKALRVGPNRTYLDGVNEGLHEPLICKLLEPNSGIKKRKRIVTHA